MTKKTLLNVFKNFSTETWLSQSKSRGEENTEKEKSLKDFVFLENKTKPSFLKRQLNKKLSTKKSTSPILSTVSDPENSFKTTFFKVPVGSCVVGSKMEIFSIFLKQKKTRTGLLKCVGKKSTTSPRNENWFMCSTISTFL